jgi:predicted DNA-binding protein with PD1-like motif
MKYSEGRTGRIFVLRLEDGEVIHQEIENFARNQHIQAAALIALGGADRDSKLVVGPLESREIPVVPINFILENVCEITGTGTLFPDEDGNPILHMHMAFGHNDRTVTGCIRSGVKVWRVVEVVLFELIGFKAVRRTEPPTCFKLLQPEHDSSTD